MDRAQLLQHFDTLADTPEAVTKLRNFVLSLAVRGQLLPQNSEDEKPPRWKEFAAKFARPKTGDVDEPPFLAPKSWRWVRLNDVADYAAADKVDPSEIKDADWVLDLEEIEKDTSRITRLATFAEKQSSSTKAKFLPGDVLYGKLRPYLNKVVVAPQVGFCTTEIVPIRSRGIIKPAHLCVFLRSPDFVGYANSKSYGMKMPRLGTDDAKSAWVAVPPPAEQRRIVAKVEELLALCDELEARQTGAREYRTRLVRSALDHLTTAQDEADFRKHSAFCLQHSKLLFDFVPALRQAILSLAVKGRLTEKKAADGNATDLLRTIAKHKEQLVKAKQLKAREIIAPVEESPSILPDNWAWCRLAEICLNITDGFHNTPKTTSSGVRYITAQHIRPNVIDFDNCFFVSEMDHQELVSKTKPRKGDILVVNIGAGSGTAAIVNADFEFSFKNVAILNKYDAIDSTYLYYVLHESRPAIFEELTKGGAQPFLSLGVLRNIVVALPPLAEQQRIVAKMDELLRWCDALEARLTAARTTATHLLDATLHQILTA